MRFDSLAAFLTVSNVLLGVSAGPLAAKRQGELVLTVSNSIADGQIRWDYIILFFERCHGRFGSRQVDYL
jgi:hypothetical protein